MNDLFQMNSGGVDFISKIPESVVDLDKLLKVNYLNQAGELSAFPNIVNKLGWLLAQANHEERISKFKLEIFSSKKRKKIRHSLEAILSKKPTIQQIEDELIEDKEYQELYEFYLLKIKDKEILESIFWSAKSKLDIISRHGDLRPVARAD